MTKILKVFLVNLAFASIRSSHPIVVASTLMGRLKSEVDIAGKLVSEKVLVNVCMSM